MRLESIHLSRTSSLALRCVQSRWHDTDRLLANVPHEAMKIDGGAKLFGDVGWGQAAIYRRCE